MQNRTAILVFLGALSVGLPAYFLFFRVDSMAPKWIDSPKRVAKPGTGKHRPSGTAAAPGAFTTPPPAATAPPE